MLAERILMTLLLGGIAIGCTLVLYPFFASILWAAILTYTTWPLYEWVRARTGMGHAAAAGAMVAAVAIVVVLPLALAVPGGADDIAHTTISCLTIASKVSARRMLKSTHSL